MISIRFRRGGRSSGQDPTVASLNVWSWLSAGDEDPAEVMEVICWVHFEVLKVQGHV